MLDLRTKILISVGISLLITALVLIIVVLSLFLKVAHVLKTAKGPECVPIRMNSSKVNQKVIPAKVASTESYSALQLCDECSMYAELDSLPPCFCGINEGL